MKLFLILLPLLLFSEFSYSSLNSPLSDSCPYGYRNSVTSIFGQKRPDVPSCKDLYGWAETGPAGWSTTSTNLCVLEQVTASNCADPEDDTENTGGCYKDDPSGCPSLKDCTTASGNTFSLSENKNCSDYTESNDPAICGESAGLIVCFVNDGGADGGATDGTTYTGGEGTGSEGGDGTGSEGGGGGEGGGEDDRTTNENSCGIGQIDGDAGCEPIPDNCGYVNGSYQCANPEPPSGCGTIQAPGELPIEDCFEQEENCGWFGAAGQEKYGCLDVTNDPTCEGGIIINGVCNNEGQEPTSCPSGYSLVNGVCENYQSCPIGTSKNSLTNACEADDCPTGKYMHMGQCLTIPEPPSAETGGETGGENQQPNEVDLSSVNSNLNEINNSIKIADSNNVNKLTQVKNSVDSVKTSVDSVGEKVDTASTTNSEKLDKLNDTVSKMNSCEEDGGAKDTLLCNKTTVSMEHTVILNTTSEVMTDFYNRISNAPIALMFTDSFEIFNQDGQCSDLVFDLSDVFGTVIRSDAHCVLLEMIRTPLGILMILVFSIAGIRVIGTA